MCYHDFWLCVIFFGVLSGCLSGPRAFWRFSDSLGTLGGLRLLAPSEAFFLDARRHARVFWSILSVVFVFPFSCVCGCFAQIRRVEPLSYKPYPGSSYPPPAPGSAVVRGRLDTAFRDVFWIRVCQRVTGNPSGTIFQREEAHIAPSGPFFTRAFLFPPQVFFFLWPSRPNWIAGRDLRKHCQEATYHPSLPPPFFGIFVGRKGE